MIGKTDKNPQLNIFRTPLVSVINMKHEFVELAQRINWKSIEKDFAVNRKKKYSDFGKMKCSKFGNKSSFAYTRGSGIIVGAMAIEGNTYDGHTLKPQLDQVKELTGGRIKKAIVDKGYQIKGGIRGVDIVMPKNLKRESY